MRKAKYEENQLTPKELVVLDFISKGKSNKQIGILSNISEQTAKNHVSNIIRKLDCGDRTGAVLVGIEKGLLVNEVVDKLVEQRFNDFVRDKLSLYVNQVSTALSNIKFQISQVPALLTVPTVEIDKLGDIKAGWELGRSNRYHTYTFVECPRCGTRRWVLTWRVKALGGIVPCRRCATPWRRERQVKSVKKVNAIAAT